MDFLFAGLDSLKFFIGLGVEFAEFLQFLSEFLNLVYNCMSGGAGVIKVIGNILRRVGNGFIGGSKYVLYIDSVSLHVGLEIIECLCCGGNGAIRGIKFALHVVTPKLL